MKSSQDGMSLVSLMIAITIGLFLSMVLFDVWYNSQRTFSSAGKLATLQDNERIASLLLRNSISMAGYYPLSTDYATSPPTMTYSDADFVADSTFSVGEVVTGSTVSGSDSISVRFVGDATTYDCLGQQTTPGGVSETGLLVEETFTASNRALLCSVNGSSNQPIANGVQSLSILYGVDTQGDGVPHQYMTATAVTNAGDWGDVKSVVVDVSYYNPVPLSSTSPATLTPIREVINLAELNS